MASFHARLRNRSAPICIGNGMEGNGLEWRNSGDFACMLKLVGARACMPLRGVVGGGDR